MAAIQATEWCVRWRELTDTLASRTAQVLALLAAGLLGWMWWLGVPWGVTAIGAPGPLLLLTFGVGRLTYRHTTRGAVRGLFQPDGWATYLEHRATMSAHAVRESAVYTRASVAEQVTRPGHARHSDVLLARIPVSETGTWLGKTAIGPPFPMTTYTSLENAILLVAAPRKLKTSAMTQMLAGAPGAAISTQTKPGTYHDTWVIRQEHSLSGYGVYLLDPEQTTGHKSSFWWAPERGCHREDIARQRAGAFIEAATKMGEDGPILQANATVLLRALLCLADVVPDRDMRDVFTWSANLDNLKRAVEKMREWRDHMPAGWPEAAAGVVHNTAVRTVGAVQIALVDAVGFMADSAVAALCVAPPDAEPDDYGFDVAEFIADRGTVYLIATDRQTAKVGPLLAAFTDYLVTEAKRIANDQDGKRLDPPMQLNLDEAANTIPMPLPKWATDTGGRGMQVIASLQSRAQADERWDVPGGKTMWDAFTVKLVAGGFADKGDLEALSAVIDTRTVTINGQDTEVPLLLPSDMRRIPRHHALLIHDDGPTTVLRVPGAWTNPAIVAGRAKARLLGEPKRRPKVLEAAPARELEAA